MKRDRRDSIKKERIIMVTSSVFVLAALTMTGLYMRGQEAKQQDDGYTLDFTALGNGTDEKLNEIGAEQAKNDAVNSQPDVIPESDLDYMPLEEELSAEAGSHLVEIPGLTDGVAQNAPKTSKKNEDSDTDKKQEASEQKEDVAQPSEAEQQAEAEQKEEAKPQNEDEEKAKDSKQASVELHYSEEEGLTKPVNGEVLLPYSMEGSIYFATLDQYKYNPATLFAAEEGDDVVACAKGRVVDVFDDAELGHAITLELGDGYKVTYGQLANVKVKKDGYVKAGDKLGTVAAPSKYYSLEGPNLYFRMEKDGAPINAENLF